MTRKTNGMRTATGLTVAVTVGLAAMSFSSSASAQQLPKAGSISFQTGWKYVADVVNAADKHVIGRGNATRVTFNEKGSGPLHLGPANCFDTFDLIDGRGKGKGYCAFGDADGDRVFTDFTGTIGLDGAQGMRSPAEPASMLAFRAAVRGSAKALATMASCSVRNGWITACPRLTSGRIYQRTYAPGGPESA